MGINLYFTVGLIKGRTLPQFLLLVISENLLRSLKKRSVECYFNGVISSGTSTFRLRLGASFCCAEKKLRGVHQSSGNLHAQVGRRRSTKPVDNMGQSEGKGRGEGGERRSCPLS